MLQFQNFQRLAVHQQYLSTIFGQKQFFFVGGIVRDLLLGRNVRLDDVDITMGGKPEEIKKLIGNGESGIMEFSFFDTEKYGTMTIIPKSPSGKEGVGGDHNFDGKEKKYSISYLQENGLVSDGSCIPYRSDNIEKAKELRKNMTLAEKKLWGFLQQQNFRVLRQKPIDHYIVDFYIASANLVIEIDGEVHDSIEAKEYDNYRTERLQSYGLQEIRFTNEEVYSDFEKVCEKIVSIVKNIGSSPTLLFNEGAIGSPQPPFQGGELGSSQYGGVLKYEITPFRTETTYSDGRHPDEIVRSDDLIEDSKRRDFTVNCMYYLSVSSITHVAVRQDEKGPQESAQSTEENNSKKFLDTLDKKGRYYDKSSQILIVQDHDFMRQIVNNTIDYTVFDLSQDGIQGVVLDPHHGINDVIAKKIRCVGQADQRFSEDALRLVRALRFAITLEFDFIKDTWISLQKHAHLIQQVAKERIKQECDKVFAGHNPFGFVALLDEAKILAYLFPRLADNKQVVQPVRYHPFDVYTHSMLVLYHLQQLSDDVLLRYAALYHDVGKVEQYKTYGMDLSTEQIREILSGWSNHVICGADFAREDFTKLGFGTKEIEQIVRYVRRHMKPGEILMSSDLDHRRKAMRKLISEVGPEIVKNLLLLTVADRLGQYNPLQAPAIEEVYGLMDVVDQLIAEEGRFTSKELAVHGDDIMNYFTISPSQEVGILLKKAFDRVSDDIATRNDKDTILKYLKGVR